MKRASAATLVLLSVILVLAASAQGQRVRVPIPRPASGDGSSGGATGYFVLIEKTGIEIYCGLYGATDEVIERGKLVKLENDSRKKDNDELDNQIKALREQIATKARDLEKAEDEAQKAQLTKEIEDLKRQIADKEPERKTLIKLIGPKEFKTREIAEKYIEARYAEADQEKEKIEDAEREQARKEREDARKKAEEEAKKKADAAKEGNDGV